MSHQPQPLYAVWPGSAYVVAKVPCPAHDQEQWYISNVETGRVSVLAPYVYRMLGRR